ncbi:MAG: serine/threonine-protein kinase [Nannocystaceae bacterium]
MVLVACPDPQALSAFSRGGLEPSERAVLESHLDACETCSRVVSELARIFASAKPSIPEPDSNSKPIDGDLDATLADDSLPKRTGARLQPGDRLERYTILELVGSGGMGVVYAAYDPSLDRKVALKVLHDRGRADGRGHRRLMREAQAMAKLAHPNVITVHEVREIDGRVFISMEFVGGTLGQWIAKTKPALPRLIAMFQGIGRGLAAAHEAGLVHSDVKPDNVLVGQDERPRVTDFGLARVVVDDSSGPDGGGSHRKRMDLDAGTDATATRTKGLMGTPAYMAPEQLLREPTTPASDQFSFCVTFYEALWGSRPFSGSSLAQLAHNVLEGKMAEPERDAGVPRWLRSVVMRGLSREPADRFESMSALLQRLEPGPLRTRRRLAVAGAVGLALVGAGSLASRVLSAPPDPCEAAAQSIERVWGAQARSSVEQALGRGSSRYATDTAALALGRIDQYAEAWSVAHRDACESYHHGGQSDEAFDLRGACLDERRRELEALVEVLVEGDPEVRRHAVEAADGLRSLTPCADVEVLRARVPPPEDLQVRARVQDLEGRLARVRALSFAGKFEEGLAAAQAVVEEARSIGHEPLLARALRLRASLHRWQGQQEAAIVDLREAWWRALAAGDDSEAAGSAVELVEYLGYGLMRFDDAQVREEEARATIERVRRYDPDEAVRLDGRLSFARGQIELRHHRYDAAIEGFERALAISEADAGPDSLRVANDLNAVASARLAKGDWEAAVEIFRRVLRIRIEQLGDAHPVTAQAGNNLGLALKNLQRYDEAARSLEQSLERLKASLGPDHPSIEMARNNLASVYYIQRRYEEAVELFDAGYGTVQLSDIDNEYVMRRVHYYAIGLSRTGNWERAREVFTMVRQRAEELDRPDTVRSAGVELARLEVDEGRPAAALEALTDHDEADVPRPLHSQIELVRARALHQLDQDEAARALVPVIRAGVDQLGGPASSELDGLIAQLGPEPAP